MRDMFRLGIVGTGLIVQESHLPACLSLGNIEVSALVDSSPGRAEQCARRFGIRPRLLSDASQLQGHVDGVLIATPDHSHASIAIQCLASGIPILVEKPLAPTNEECEQIRQASEINQTSVSVGYMFRFWPSVSLVKNLLDAGTFGKPRRFYMQVGSTGGWSPLSGYYLRSNARGAMSINGSHFLDRALHWFGFPRTVEYCDDSAGGPEANARALLGYDALEGVIRVSRTAKLKPGCAIETDRGLLVHRDWEDPIVEFIPNDPCEASFRVSDAGYTLASRPDIYRLQLEDFAASSLERRPPRVSLAEGIGVTRLINALYGNRRPMATDFYSVDQCEGTGR